jgi:hypothetical protein
MLISEMISSVPPRPRRGVVRSAPLNGAISAANGSWRRTNGMSLSLLALSLVGVIHPA